MSPDVALKALELAFARPSTRLQISFFGGEPLLEAELIDVIATRARELAEATEKTTILSMTTNGTLLTESNLDLIERHDIKLAVSIDGDREAHGSARIWPNRRGSFAAVDAGLRRALARLRQVDTITVVHQGNVDRLAGSFDYLASLGVRRFAFNMNYEEEWDDEALERLERGVEVLVDRVLAHYRKGNNFTVAPFHSKIVSRLKGGFCAEDRCDFGCNEWAVAPSGRIYPCDRLIGEDGPCNDGVVIGHVDTGVDETRVNALKEPKDTVKADCADCAMVDRCMWWCGCVNHALTGRVDEVSGLLCHVEQLYVAAADRLASTLFSEQNPPFMRRYYLASIVAGA